MNSECTNSFTKNEAPITPTNLNLVTFTKYTSTGPLSKSYSVDASGAVVRVGRKVLIDLDKFFIWVAEQGVK
jgi:hypothetical protein